MAGRKKSDQPTKVKVNYTVDAALLVEIDKRTSNRSGFLNAAAWEKLKRDSRRDSKSTKGEKE